MANKEHTNATTLSSIRQAHEELLPLIETTQAVIGAVAMHNYAALQEKPAANGYPIRHADTSFPSRFMIFRPYRIIRAVTPPKEAAFTDRLQTVHVIQAQTETYRRQAGPIPQMPLSRFVMLHLRYLGHDAEAYDERLAISTDGYSDINGSSLPTFPQGFHHPESTYAGLGVVQLKADYAQKYKEGLRVAHLIAFGLQQAYDIKNITSGPTSPLAQTWDAWDAVQSGRQDITPRKSPE